MAGCDYLPSIKGIGIRKAIEFLDKNVKFETTISRLRFNKTFMGKIPRDYEAIANNMLLIFMY